MRKIIPLRLIFFIFLLFTVFTFPQQYILLGWNDLGMHCSNKDFSKIAVLPPYNNIHAQLILKMPNQLPQIVTTGYIVEYSIPGNTYSVGKTNFWTYAQLLFNLPVPLTPNIGLTGYGLTGAMDTSGNNFFATGIPVTPFQDDDLINEKPYHTIHLAAKTVGGNTVLAFTDVVIPVSNEIGCVNSGCHASEQAILNDHENVSGFSTTGPNLCAKCHASNALGTPGNSEAGIFSYRIHNAHKDLLPANEISTCYNCHPGPNTQCFRDIMRNNPNNPLKCQNCHGTLSDVASSVAGGRRPWLDEPKCGNTACHGSNFAEEPNKLFRMSEGHGDLFCSACHGSPHAILPTSQPNDNLQNIRLQGFAGTLKTCLTCHTSPPPGAGPHGIVYSSVENDHTTPGNCILYNAYPNPFNPKTHIDYTISKSGHVELKVYDAMGNEVTTLVNKFQTPGKYTIDFSGNSFASGVYYYTLSSGGYKKTQKMLLLK
jgi:hypothetical protein